MAFKMKNPFKKKPYDPFGDIAAHNRLRNQKLKDARRDNEIATLDFNADPNVQAAKAGILMKEGQGDSDAKFKKELKKLENEFKANIIGANEFREKKKELLKKYKKS